MAATKRNAMLIAEARQKIRTTQLINRLQDHALGKVEMSPTQVRATEVLLRKAVPDLTAISGSIEVTRSPRELTDAELLAIASGNRAIVPQEGEEQPSSVH